MQRIPRRPVAVRRPLALACALGAVLVLAAGCGGGDDAAGGASSAAAQSDSGDASSSSSSTDGAASDGGSSDGASAGGASAGDDSAAGESEDASGDSSSAEPIAVKPPEQKPELTDACTGEGAFLVKGEKPNDPALPERDDLTLKISLEDLTDDDGADLVADIDGTKRPIETTHVGDTIAVDQWTLSVTSVCADSVEFDLID